MRRVAGFRQSAASRAGRRKRAAEARAAALPASAGRKARSGERREAILAAALDEFSSRGFEAARLEDVARRAGVAKGTIYLYFRDKENLFQELIRTMLTPLVGTIEAMGQADVPLPVLADRIVDLFVSQVYETRRKDVVRLMRRTKRDADTAQTESGGGTDRRPNASPVTHGTSPGLLQNIATIQG